MRRVLADEGGAGTVSAVATIAVLLLLAAVAIAGAGVHVSKTRAQAGVDLAALAGASAIVDQLTASAAPDPCATATQVAAVNGVALTSCTVDGGDVLVSGKVAVSVAAYDVVIAVQARAGTDVANLLRPAAGD